MYKCLFYIYFVYFTFQNVIQFTIMKFNLVSKPIIISLKIGASYPNPNLAATYISTTASYQILPPAVHYPCLLLLFIMATLTEFSLVEKISHNSHKFGFTLSPKNYGYLKAIMIQPFLITNNIFGYVEGTIRCPSPLVTKPGKEGDPVTTTSNPSHSIL